MKKVILIFLLVGIQVYCKSQVYDIDSNYYKTVKYGYITWMAENLKTTRYLDSTLIPNVTDFDEWKNLTTGALCDYDNLPENSEKYGKLYNFYAVETKNICPWGWHVSTQNEWIELEEYLLIQGIASLYSESSIPKALAFSSGWKSDDCAYESAVGCNQLKNNMSKFSALGAGYREYDAKYYDITYQERWWTSTSLDLQQAWDYSIRSSSGGVCRYMVDYSGIPDYDTLLYNHWTWYSQNNKNAGQSIRCVKDKDFLNISAEKIRVCIGDSVKLKAEVYRGIAPFKYTWISQKGNESTNVVYPQKTTTYTVRVEDRNGVRDEASITIFVSEKPKPDFTFILNSDTYIADFQNKTNEIELQNNTTIENSYQWQFELNSTKVPQSSKEALRPISYKFEPYNEYDVTLWVTNTFGCKDSITKKIDMNEMPILSVPSAFSPNNDGLNDVLYAVGRNIENITWIIYDRWGQKIFESNSLLNGWDGTFNGKELEAAVYIYYISGIATYDGKKIERKGDITIIK